MNPPARAAADWVSQSRHGAVAPGLGMEAVRGFASFLHAHDPAHEIPPPGLFPGRRLRAVPYLYSPADIAALQAAAGRPDLRQRDRQRKDHPHVIRILDRAWIRVIYRCWIDGIPYDPSCGALTTPSGCRAGARYPVAP